MDNRVFVLIVNLDLEKFLDALGWPHFDGVPRHPLADVHADFAADALIESHLYIGDNDVDAVRRVAWSMFDAIHRTETYARLAARAVVRNHDGDLFRLLFLA